MNSEEGNDLVDDLRPKDFLPRSVYKEIPFRYPTPHSVTIRRNWIISTLSMTPPNWCPWPKRHQ